MFVIWKRPDGFHGAKPEDFAAVEVGQSRIWLHRTDRDGFPFRISGGWEEDASKRLNNLVNLLPGTGEEFCAYLVKTFNNSMKDDSKEFYADVLHWLSDLKNNLKGDKWEVDIMRQTIEGLERRMQETKERFFAALN